MFVFVIAVIFCFLKECKSSSWQLLLLCSSLCETVVTTGLSGHHEIEMKMSGKPQSLLEACGPLPGSSGCGRSHFLKEVAQRSHALLSVSYRPISALRCCPCSFPHTSPIFQPARAHQVLVFLEACRYRILASLGLSMQSTHKWRCASIFTPFLLYWNYFSSSLELKPHHTLKWVCSP